MTGGAGRTLLAVRNLSVSYDTDSGALQALRNVSLEVSRGEIVGRYALRFKWSDGHETGIYSFTALRQMCQCDICQPHKEKEKKSKVLL